MVQESPVQETPIGFDFSFPLRVYVEDTDAGGIVYYVNYLKFMERGRTEFMRSIGFEQKLGQGSESQFVVHSADVKYLKPAILNDELLTCLTIKKLGKTYIIFDQQITDKQNKILYCSAEIKIACVSLNTYFPGDVKPIAMPTGVRDSLKSLLEKRRT